MHESNEIVKKFPNEILSLIFSYLKPHEALKLALTNKHFLKIFNDFYIKFLLGLPLNVSLINEPINEYFYTKLRLPFHLTQKEEYEKIRDIEKSLYSIGVEPKNLFPQVNKLPMNSEKIFKELKGKYPFLEEANLPTIAWQIYYHFVLKTYHVEDINKLFLEEVRSLYEYLYRNNFSEEDIIKLLVNYFGLTNKPILMNPGFLNLQQYDAKSANYFSVLKKIPEMHPVYIKLAYRSGLKSKFIHQILTHQLNTLSQAADENISSRLEEVIYWLRELLNLIKIDKPYRIHFYNMLRINSSSQDEGNLIIRVLNSLLNCSDNSLKEFICDFFNDDCENLAATYFRRYFSSVLPNSKFSLKLATFISQNTSLSKEEESLWRIKLSTHFMGSLRKFATSEVTVAKNDNLTTLKQKGQSLFLKWKEIVNWHMEYLNIEPAFLVKLGQLYEEKFGAKNKIYISECGLTKKNQSVITKPLEFYKAYLQLDENKRDQKLTIIASERVAELTLELELAKKNSNYEKSIECFYQLNKIKYDKSDKSSFIGQASNPKSLYYLIPAIGDLLYFMENPNYNDQISHTLELILREPEGRELFDKFKETQLAKKMGVDQLYAKNQDLVQIKNTAQSVMLKIEQQTEELLKIKKKLGTLLESSPEQQIQCLSSLRDIEQKFEVEGAALSGIKTQIESIITTTPAKLMMPTPARLSATHFFAPLNNPMTSVSIEAPATDNKCDENKEIPQQPEEKKRRLDSR